MTVATTVAPAVATKRTFKWRDDYLAEKIAHGESPNATLHIRTITLGDIDWVRSSNNGARQLQAFDEESIEDYMHCFESGDAFPRPVVSHGRDGYVILGGNQRCMAIRRLAEQAGESLEDYEIEVYVMEGTTPQENDIILRALNRSNGYTPDRGERLQHALYLVNVLGCPADKAAKSQNVGVDLLKTHVKAETTRATIAKDGIDSSKFTVTALTSLARVKDRKIRNNIAKVVEAHQPTASAVSEVVADVVAGTSEYRREKAVEKWSNNVAKSKAMFGPSPGGRKSAYEKLHGKLYELRKFLDEGNRGDPFNSLDELSCTSEDAKQLLPIVALIKARLDIITGGY